MGVLNIPSRFDFLKSIRHFVVEKAAGKLALSDFTILLPSRRSCNELKRIFLEASEEGALILPNIRAIGDIDYDDLVLKQINKNDMENLEDFSSNTSRIKYKILLLKELLKWGRASGKDMFKNMTVEQASNLALELEKFLNEVNRNGLDLANLGDIVDEEYSKHWQEVLNFLEIFGKKWGKFISENNIISVTDFRTKIIEFNAQYFEKNRPINPIIVAGVSGSVRSTCNLISSLLRHDNCYYIFKSLDKNLSDDEWKKVDVFHPQHAHKNLLENCIKVDRSVVKNIVYTDAEVVGGELEKILGYAMLPSSETHIWKSVKLVTTFLANISKIECANNFEELMTISFMVKHRHETSDETIAVIVSDDNFADQLETSLKSLDIAANNVFGNKISRTDLVKFLFLILDVLKSDFETVALLSLLKYKFSLFGYTRDELDGFILSLEDNILRGVGNIGKNGILKMAKKFGDEVLIEFVGKIFKYFSEFSCDGGEFQNVLKSHLSLAERIASGGDVDGQSLFWDSSELLNFFTEMAAESAEYGSVKSCDEYSHLLNYLIAENSYSDSYSIHPMVTIISPQESRLINYDFVILANLNDGKFPPHVSADPWMSRSMRKAFGLPSRDELIGSYAYDFTQILNCREVVLTRALKENGTPAIKSKYLMRLETFLLCQGLKLSENNIWKEVFKKYNSVEATKTIARPKPTPPLDRRPKELYATKIEKLMNNPYDIYAEKILNLKKKDDFYENNVFALFGSAVHGALEKYVQNYDATGDKFEKLMAYGREAFGEYFTDEVSRELFFIRFSNIAKWFIAEDEKIRSSGYKVYAERVEKMYLADLDFTIAAKIDRLEEGALGINIIDYKTGNAPSNSEVLGAKKPQLIIEAIIMESKGKKTEKLAYWSIKGKNNENISEIDGDISELTAKGLESVKKLISYFQIYENSYIATSFDLNDDKHYASDYKHLSRVEEWGYL